MSHGARHKFRLEFHPIVVIAMVTIDEIRNRVQEKFPKAEFIEEQETENTVWFLVPREELVDVAMFLKHELELVLPNTITGHDKGEEVIVWYHVENPKDPLVVSFGVKLTKPDLTVPSLVSVWEGMNWHERETYDLVGVIFEGHPNLKRILNPDDWNGHPLQVKPKRRRKK